MENHQIPENQWKSFSPDELFIYKTLSPTVELKVTRDTGFAVSQNPAGIYIKHVHSDNKLFYPMYRNAPNQENSEAINPKPLNFNKEIIDQIARQLQMELLSDTVDGNLCFAQNNDELQDDFKMSFTALDIFDYVIGALHKNLSANKVIEAISIPFPFDNNQFWQLVKQGKKLRINS